MEFRELKSFLYIVQYENFSKAAEALYISQPTISLHIKNLESELHFELFKRSTKKIILTDKGKALYEYAKKLFSIEKSFLDNLNHKFNNQIKVGASSIPAGYLLPELIEKFKERYNNVDFEILQADSEDILGMYKVGLIDVGMIGMDIKDKNFISKSFYKDRLVLITKNEKNENHNIDIKELLLKPFILREDGSGTRKMSEKILVDYGVYMENLNIVAKVTGQDTLINLVKAGIGVSIVSYKSVMQYEKNKEILVYDFNSKHSERNLNIIYSNKKNEKQCLKDFINFVKSYYI